MKKYKSGDSVIIKHGFLIYRDNKGEELEEYEAPVYLGKDRKEGYYWYDVNFERVGMIGTVKSKASYGDVYNVEVKVNGKINNWAFNGRDLKLSRNG